MYRNQHLGLSTAILRVHKSIFQEAAAILYGENEFVYLLRDAANQVTDADAVAENNTADLPSDVEEEPAWGPVTRSRRRGRKPAIPKPLNRRDIYLEKYVLMMRRISLEAEHNRFNDEAKDRAATAINIFAKQYTKKQPTQRSLATNLRSLVVRVVPTWEEQSQDFTFIDWFDKGSSLMESIRSLSCDEITVKLLVPNSNGGGLALSSSRLRAAAPQKEEQGATHVLDMHCYQLDRMLKSCKIKDPWVGDEAITSGREARAKGMAIELDKLQATLRKYCYDPAYGERGWKPPVESDDEEDTEGDAEEEDGDEDMELIEEFVEPDDEDDEDYEDGG